MQFLGRISMSLYLVHMPAVEWMRLFMYGTFDEPLPRHTFATLPPWTIPLQIMLLLIVATALTVLVEEPSKNRLKKMLKIPEKARRFRLLGVIFVSFGATGERFNRNNIGSSFG